MFLVGWHNNDIQAWSRARPQTGTWCCLASDSDSTAHVGLKNLYHSEGNVQELFQEARLFVAMLGRQSEVETRWPFWLPHLHTARAKEAPRWSPTGVRGEATQPWLRLQRPSGPCEENFRSLPGAWGALTPPVSWPTMSGRSDGCYFWPPLARKLPYLSY